MAQTAPLTGFDDMPVGPAGTAGSWVVGAGVVTTNTRVIDSGAYRGQQAFAVDFETGAATTGYNLSQSNFPMGATAIPAAGVNALQFAVKAPAGTVFSVTLVLSNDKVWEAKRQIQSLNNQWEVFTIALSNLVVAANSAGTDLAALNQAAVTTSWGALQVIGAGDGLGTPNLSGTLALDDFKLVQSNSISLMDFESYGPSGWGDTNIYRPDGSTVVTTNGRIIATDRAQGLKSYAIDFDNGGGDGFENYSQSAVWVEQTAWPASGVNAFQVRVKGPAGATIRFTLVDTDLVGHETPLIPIELDQTWQTLTLPFEDFPNNPISPAELAALHQDGEKIDSVALKVYGGDRSVPSLTGTIHLDDLQLVNVVAPTAAHSAWECY